MSSPITKDDLMRMAEEEPWTEEQRRRIMGVLNRSADAVRARRRRREAVEEYLAAILEAGGKEAGLE